MPTAGLDISDDAIRFIELRSDRHAFLLEKYDSQELPGGVIQNGTIQQKEELIAALTEVREANDLKFVRVSLPEEKSYLYHASVPYLSDDSQMRESVSYTIEENVPLSMEDVVFDYDVVATESPQEEEEVDVVVSVLPVEVVEEYLDVITTSGFQPLALMVESQAVAKAVVPKDDPGAYLIIHLKGEKTIAYIVNNNAVHFTSAFAAQNGSVSVPAHMSFVGEDTAQETKESGEDASSSELQEHSVTSIATEAKRVIDYWHTQAIGSQEGGKITNVILCGDHADNDEFKQALSAKLQLNVQTANVWVNALDFDVYIPEIPMSTAFHYTAAIGLALPQHMLSV